VTTRDNLRRTVCHLLQMIGRDQDSHVYLLQCSASAKQWAPRPVEINAGLVATPDSASIGRKNTSLSSVICPSCPVVSRDFVPEAAGSRCIPRSRRRSAGYIGHWRAGAGNTQRLGYSRTLLVEKSMRDAKISDIYEGTQQINQLIIARRILGHSSETLRAAGGRRRPAVATRRPFASV
jgi:alkylation response protein AidB-like acyl-CoA dehydrogenase